MSHLGSAGATCLIGPGAALTIRTRGLGRPPDGWAEGKYRVEFYVNDELEETIRVTIVK